MSRFSGFDRDMDDIRRLRDDNEQLKAELAAEALVIAQGYSIDDPLVDGEIDYGQRVQNMLPAVVAMGEYALALSKRYVING